MLKSLALATAIAAGLTGTAMAKVVTWSAKLDQAQEGKVKYPVAAAAGTATGTLDTKTHKLSWDLSYTGLSGHPTGIHFYGPASAGKVGHALVNIGKDSGLRTPTKGSVKLSAKAMKEFEKGLWYISIQTAKNPHGEIRGQAMAAM